MDMKRRLLAVGMCLILLLAPAGCAGGEKAGEEAAFTLKVVHGDGAEVSLDVTTDKETLGEALLEREIIGGDPGPYGLYVKTVDGETADEALEQWWCLTKGGESVNTGVDSTPVEDGAAYEFTLTEGY